MGPSSSLKWARRRKLRRQKFKLEEFESRAQCSITSAALLLNSSFAVLIFVSGPM